MAMRDLQGYFYVGALIFRIGFGGPLYYIFTKDPQNSIGNDSGPYINLVAPVTLNPSVGLNGTATCRAMASTHKPV